MKRKGINAKAWFYSQSFHSSALDVRPKQEAPANDKDPDAVSRCQRCQAPYGSCEHTGGGQ